MHANNLSHWGASDRVLTEANSHLDLSLARVITQERGQYTVVSTYGEHQAILPGKFLYNTDEITALPGVGDWVMIAGDAELAVVQHVLPRSSCIVRKVAGTGQHGQVIAANVDTVFICMALNEDFNLRRMERYLAIVWDSGATPVIVLTKSDLAPDLDQQMREITSISPGVDVVVTAALEQRGLDSIKPYMGTGRTIAFIGSSGVGKSTLINVLLGEDLLLTRGLRNDGQGRHTTTHREAILLPGGGVLIDTPGMRELGLGSAADIDRAFSDIEELAAQCRFSNCTHTSEPGCAVRSAMLTGELDEKRLASYHKLSSEADYVGKTSRQIADEKVTKIFGSKAAQKAARREFKTKEKNRMGY